MHYSETPHAFGLIFQTGLQVAALIQLLADEDVVLVERADLLDTLTKYGRTPGKDKACDTLIWRTRKVLKPYGIEILAVSNGKGRSFYITDESKRKISGMMKVIRPYDRSVTGEEYPNPYQ